MQAAAAAAKQWRRTIAWVHGVDAVVERDLDDLLDVEVR
jgi:hypothetical protein